MTAVGLVAVLTLAFTACGPNEEQMSPEQVRDALTTLAHDTASLLGDGGWADDGAPLPGACGDGVKWSIGIATAQPDSDRIADAQKVADHWKSLGIEVRVNTEHDPVVFGTGGPVRTISFSTGPSVYDISGTSLCAPGDVDDYR